MRYEKHDGGAAAAGYKSRKDCVCRAVAIATGESYFKIRCELAHVQESVDGRYSGGDGIHTTHRSFEAYAASKGFFPIDVMQLDRIPETGVYLVRVHRHMFCVKDGVLYDMWDGQVASPRYGAVLSLWQRA